MITVIKKIVIAKKIVKFRFYIQITMYFNLNQKKKNYIIYIL